MSKLRKVKHSWRFPAAAPPREIFASMEQMLGTPPYRFEPVDGDTGRITEVERKGFFGNWTRRVRRPRWVTCATEVRNHSTVVVVETSAGKAPLSRALQLVQLLTRGNRDRRTIYRDRTIPPGPVSLVASWAGMPYRLRNEPRFDSWRGQPVYTATALDAIAQEGPFVKVRMADGTEGYIDRDQLVPAPAEAVREAQAKAASHG